MSSIVQFSVSIFWIFIFSKLITSQTLFYNLDLISLITSFLSFPSFTSNGFRIWRLHLVHCCSFPASIIGLDQNWMQRWSSHQYHPLFLLLYSGHSSCMVCSPCSSKKNNSLKKVLLSYHYLWINQNCKMCWSNKK